MAEKYRNLIFVLFCLFSLNFYSQNLITNGDFGTFNASVPSPPPLGYTTTYSQMPYNNGAGIAAGKYSITNNPSLLAPTSLISTFDISNGVDGDGTGNMMFVKGKGNQVFWQLDQPTLTLTVGVTYLFSFWIKNVHTNTTAANPAPIIDLKISGFSVGTFNTLGTNPLFPKPWVKRSYSFVATTTSITIQLSTVNAGPTGNNFVIDDISLTPPIIPMTASFVKTDPSCPTVIDGSIVAYTNSGVPPYTYNLTGAKTDSNNTGVFTGLASGSYVVEVIDSDAVPVTITSSTLNLVAPVDMTLSSTASGCMAPNSSVTLTASNGVLPYTWSASTGVAITSTAAIPPAVTPLITTTYTVTSSRTIPNTNLVTNGGFESSNSGFYSDFIYTPLSASLTQFDYGITTNPNLWNSAFITSAARSGTKMFVAKGATVANKIIWSQTVLVDNSKTYTFEFYAQNAVATSPAQFRVLINGVQIIISPVAATNPGWTRISGIWNSALAKTAKIQIINTNIALAGNDFAIDDISFSTAAAAKSCSLIKTVDVKVIVTSNFADIPDFCSGSPAPLLSTTSPNGIVGTWMPATINNTTPGSYTFLPTVALDACAIGQTLNTTVTSVTNPGTLSGNQNICLGLDNTFSSTVSGGTWSSSNSAIASVNSVSGIVRGVATGTATLTYTVIGKGCSDATNTITVSVTAPPNAGTLSGNQNVCLGLQTTFKSTIIGGEWKSLDTSVATIDSASGEITGVTIGTTTMTYTVSGSGSCANASETRVVTISNGSSAGVLSGTQNVCIGSATIFISTVTDGQWSSSNINIATVNINTGEVTGVAAGRAIITYKIADINGCLSTPSNLEVTVASLPNAGTLSGTQNACVGLNTTFSSTTIGGTWVSEDPFIATVDATTGEVTGVAAGITTINYTITGIGGCKDAIAPRAVTVTAPPTVVILSGTQNICATFTTPFSSSISGGAWSSSNNAIATVNEIGEVSGVSEGTVIITYKLLGTGGCLDSSSGRNVIVFTPPNAGTLSGTQNVCIGFSPTFSSTSSGGSWSSSDTAIATVDALTGILSGVSVGTATITYSVSGLGGCPNAFVSRDITFNNDTNAGLLTGNTNLCQGLTTPLLSSIPGGTWSSSDNNIATVNVVGVVTGVSAGSVTITYTISPTQGQCVKASFKDIEVNTSIIPIFNSVNPICSGEAINSLPPISINGVKGNWLPILDNLTTKTYTFTPDNDQQCAIKQELTITVKDFPEFQIKGECNSKNYELSTNLNSNFSYNWLNAMSENISTTNSAIVTKNGNYSLEVVSDGCKSIKEYEVKNVSCNYPKGISPNNDEYNNFFDLENFEVKRLQIYNRYGQEVYSKNNYKNEWSGSSNDGKELPDGTYYYVITLLNNDKPDTGWVYINR